MRTRVYIDGFNLYYGCLKGSAHRWLDVVKLSKALFPTDTIEAVRYFTADVKPWPNQRDKGDHYRQGAYIRALKTLAEVSVHKGRYVIREKDVSLVAGGRAKAWVSEEKGSDVNLASFLLLDASRGAFERAVVVSNDSDLVEPIKMVRREFKLAIALAPPLGGPMGTRQMPRELKNAADEVRKIRQSHLGLCHLPPTLMGAHGKTITKPPRW